MSAAELKAAQGAKNEARALYFQAAEAETRAYTHIPAARTRTRGIIAVSAVALYQRAGVFDEAIRYAHWYLSHPELPDFARAQLVALLAESQRESQTPAFGGIDTE